MINNKVLHNQATQERTSYNKERFSTLFFELSLARCYIAYLIENNAFAMSFMWSKKMRGPKLRPEIGLKFEQECHKGH